VTVVRRLWLVAVLAAVATGGWAGYLWLRDVSVLRVQHVKIEGTSGPEASAIDRALRQTARRMTTLHVQTDALNAAVDSFPVVRSVSASASFPNTLHIKVHEYDAVAALAGPDGRRTAVGEGGIMLRGSRPGDHLPTIQVASVPQSRMLGRGVARTLVGVLSAAPRPLTPLLERAYVAGGGVRVSVRQGPVIQFGAPTRLAAKWAAATRVLADHGSGGARFIDVRLPERPAAGQTAPGSASTQSGASTTTAQAGAATAPDATATNTQP
jgi:cell division protein FtsQ